jgi:hypothetical protein
LCFIGQTDVIKQDTVLPVVMAVDAVAPAVLHKLLYWKAVTEGIQDRADQPTALGKVGSFIALNSCETSAGFFH